MKKNGFTLAEILISIGIVGTIAAITLPSLMTNTTSAQIGPKLAKAVSVFEQANEALLNENSVDKLSETNFLVDSATYGAQLSRFLKITPNADGSFFSKDGMTYTFTISNANPLNDISHRQRIGDVTIDINGSSLPNLSATDIFYFSWWNDGSLRPKGGTNWNGGAAQDKDEGGQAIGNTDSVGGSEHWSAKCAANAIPSGEDYCAGHVFENNFKVLYK